MLRPSGKFNKKKVGEYKFMNWQNILTDSEISNLVSSKLRKLTEMVLILHHIDGKKYKLKFILIQEKLNSTISMVLMNAQNILQLYQRSKILDT